MMYIFIWYTFGIVHINNFLNKLGQTLYRLTFEKTYMHYDIHKDFTIYTVT
jgi:hypothetical protein